MGIHLVTRFLPLLCLPMLVGCVSLDYSADYQEQRGMIFFPFVNCTDRTILKTDYLNERLFFPKFVPKLGAPVIRYKSFIDELGDHGYFVIFASDENQGHISESDLALAVGGMMPEALSGSVYDYAVAVSLDSFTAPALATLLKLDLTIYIFDIKESKLIWTAKESKHQWKGILVGPLARMVAASGAEYGAPIGPTVLGEQIGKTVAVALSRSPLLSSK